ncbi:MAG TPA: hypothetical protein VLA48_03335 [Nitrososphaeraceae archaeon]|nr:hypothetical protein [Nitrososphaeraceae archaeon]
MENFTEDLTCSNIPKGQTLTETIVALDAYICERFESVTNFFNLINVGTGSQIYKGISNLGKKELRTLVGSGLINIAQGTDTITISVNETALNTFIEVNQKTYSALNVGTGAEVYKNTSVVGDNTQLNLRKIKSTDGSVTIVQGTDDINLSVPAAIIPDGSETKIVAGANGVITGTGTILNPYVISSDGGETKITAGSNTSVTGNGTTATPYVINAVPDGSETKINSGTNTTVTGLGTIASPYIINAATPDGSETKITNGTNTTVVGTGTTGSPYQINVPSFDGSETKITAGGGTTVSGNGTIATPYQINIPKNNVVNTGFFAGLNVGTTGTLTIGGDITAAVTTLGVPPDSIITVTVANPMPNTNYTVDVKLQGQSANLNDDNDVATPVFKVISTTQFQIGLREISNNTQNLKIHIQTIAQ